MAHVSTKLIVLFALVLLLIPFSFAVITDGSLSIYAVTSAEDALEAQLNISVRQGTGKIWSSVGPLVGTSTQHTEKISVALAEDYFDDIKEYDFLFDINSNASVVEGPSAGAAMSLLLITMLQDKPLPKYIGITGTISDDGSIGPVGGVFEKTKKASETGKKIFMIPKGEAYQMHRFDDGVKTVDLREYGFKEWGIKIIEVKNIDEALEYAFIEPKDIEIDDSPETDTHSEFVPREIIIPDELAPMKELTADYLVEADQAIKDAKDALNASPIDEATILSALLESLQGSEKLLEEGKLLQEKNYMYSSANYSFIAIVESRLVKDLSQNPSLIEPNSKLLEVKVRGLAEEIELAEVDMNKFYSMDMFEWVVASKQRLYWAKEKVNKLQSMKTIVIGSSESSISDIGVAIDDLRDYEYARTWLDVSKDFWAISERAEDKFEPVNVFYSKASEYIISAENELVFVSDDESTDIQRRLNSAKMAMNRGWNDSSLFDAASAFALARAEKELKGKGLQETLDTLGETLSLIDAKFVASDNSDSKFVWAKLYFDHARYYFDSAQFFDGEGDKSKALENAKAGLRLAFFAEEMLNAKIDAWDELTALSGKSKYTPPIKSFESMSIEEILDNKNSLAVLLIIAVGIGVAIVLVWSSVTNSYKYHNEEKFISKRMERLEMLKHQAHRARIKNKLGEKEFAEMTKGYEKELKQLELERIERSKHLIEINGLHGEIEKTKYMLAELKDQYEQGKIVEQDYRAMLETLTGRLGDIKGLASTEEKTVFKESKKIEEIQAKIGYVKKKKPVEKPKKVKGTKKKRKN